jgi:hypothetical protein
MYCFGAKCLLYLYRSSIFPCVISLRGGRGFLRAVGILIIVDAMEVLVKYCMNSFPQVDQFIRIQIFVYFLCVSYWSIGSETKSNWLIYLFTYL